MSPCLIIEAAQKIHSIQSRVLTEIIKVHQVPMVAKCLKLLDLHFLT